MSAQSDHIDNMNYVNDIRNQDGPKIPENLPTCWAICYVCEGDGKVVNPSIDAGGLSADDFDEDPDFAEQYMSGTFDIACRYCGGSGKIREVDRDRADLAQLQEYDDDEDDRLACEAESRAERMMGA